MTSSTDSETVPTPYINDPRIEKDAEGLWHVRGYAEARDLLKEELIQDGFNAEDLRKAALKGFFTSMAKHIVSRALRLPNTLARLR